LVVKMSPGAGETSEAVGRSASTPMTHSTPDSGSMRQSTSSLIGPTPSLWLKQLLPGVWARMAVV
jgi:hypothetical protein